MDIWYYIQPWVIAFSSSISVGAIVSIVVAVFNSKLATKRNLMLTKLFDTDKLSDLCVEKLVGKIVNIDATAITEQALQRMHSEFLSRAESVVASNDSYKRLLALVANAISKSRALTNHEVEELQQAIVEVQKDYTPPPKLEPMIIKLEPLEIVKDLNKNDLDFGGF